MTDVQANLIREIKGILEGKLKGVQYMGLEDGIAKFESFGQFQGQYRTFTVDLDLIEEYGIYEIVENYVSVFGYEDAYNEKTGEYDKEEYDVDEITYIYDEKMEQVKFIDVTHKTYKREKSALKYASEKFGHKLRSANVVWS